MPGILNSYAGGGGGGGGGGPLSMYIIPGDPTNVYNPSFSGSSNRNQTAIVSGGTPPYSYQWTRLSADDGINGTNLTSNPATFSATGTGGVTLNTRYEQWECEVTDDAMATVSDNFWIQFIFGAEEP